MFKTLILMSAEAETSIVPTAPDMVLAAEAAAAAKEERRIERRKRKKGWGAPSIAGSAIEMLPSVIGGLPAEGVSTTDTFVVRRGGAEDVDADKAETQGGDKRVKRRRQSRWGAADLGASAAGGVIGVDVAVAAASGHTTHVGTRGVANAASPHSQTLLNMQPMIVLQHQQQQQQQQQQRQRQLQQLQQQLQMQQLAQYTQHQHQQTVAASSMNRLFISNIGSGVTEDMLKEAVTSLGAVLQCGMMKEEATQNGFFVVEFSSTGVAEKALQTLNGLELAGRPLRVVRAPSSQQAAPAPALVQAQAQVNAQLQLQLSAQMQQLQVQMQMLRVRAAHPAVQMNPAARLQIQAQMQSLLQSQVAVQMQIQMQLLHQPQPQAAGVAQPALAAAPPPPVKFGAVSGDLPAADAGKLSALLAGRTALQVVTDSDD
jgi:hypothetical protein